MKTPVHRWPMTEGSGLVIADVIGSLPLTIVSVGGHPQWLSAEPGLHFSGGVMGDGYAYDPLNNANCIYTNVGPFGISAWFNLRGNTNRAAFGGRPIFGLSHFEPYYGLDRFASRHGFQDTLYIGNLGHACFSGHYNNAATDYHRAGVGTTDLTGSDEWHHIFGYLQYPNQKVYLDGVFEGMYTAVAISRPSTEYRGFCLGSGATWGPYVQWYGGNPPETTSASNGTFPGDIRDACFFCGVMTDEDVWDVYNEFPPPNVEIIGNCPFPSTSRACNPRSESLICSPSSRVRLVPSTR